MQETTLIEARSSRFAKFVECFFAAIAISNAPLMFLELLPRTLLLKLGGPFISFILLGQFAVGLIFAMGYSLYWHRKEIAHSIDSGIRHAWLRGILRYWLALELSTYGFAKILKTQFGQSYSRGDTPVGSLDGFSLTWNYFAYSYSFAVIIALVQIGGAILLLFRRTTLLGAAILIPVMVNITLINLFYKIAAGAFMNSILFTMGLLYLLLLRRKELKEIFFRKTGELPRVGSGFFKAILRFLVIGVAFGLIYYFTTKNPGSPLVGKWQVDQQLRNGDTVKSSAWITDPTAWKAIYMEDYGKICFCPNPYLYDEKRSEWGDFTYDSSRHRLRLIFARNAAAADTVNVAISNYKSNSMEWETIFRNDTVLLQLSKVEKNR